MKFIVFALIPLILSIGIIPAIPFSDGVDIPHLLQICIDKVWVERTAGKRAGQIVCVFPSTAEKLVERGWGTMLVIVEDISDEKSITPVIAGGTLPITQTPIIGNPEKEYPKNYVPGTEELGEDEIRLIFLGTGMPFPTRNQAAAGVLIEFGNGEILIFDVGSGTVANFNSLEISPAELTKFFITHLHTDHQGDLDMY
ncbi:MAG: MBL fold metallo-hydrolase, partial [Nitrosopumilus sp.]